MSKQTKKTFDPDAPILGCVNVYLDSCGYLFETPRLACVHKDNDSIRMAYVREITREEFERLKKESGQ